jgi:hypothetical protein
MNDSVQGSNGLWSTGGWPRSFSVLGLFAPA